MNREPPALEFSKNRPKQKAPNTLEKGKQMFTAALRRFSLRGNRDENDRGHSTSNESNRKYMTGRVAVDNILGQDEDVPGGAGGGFLPPTTSSSPTVHTRTVE